MDSFDRALSRRIAELEAELKAGAVELEAAKALLAQRLQGKTRARNVFSEHMNISPEAKASKNLKISKKASKDPLAKACQAQRISVRELARQLKVSPGSLVAYRSTRRIPGALADEIQRIVGFEATQANWPAGIDR